MPALPALPALPSSWLARSHDSTACPRPGGMCFPAGAEDRRPCAVETQGPGLTRSAPGQGRGALNICTIRPIPPPLGRAGRRAPMYVASSGAASAQPPPPPHRCDVGACGNARRNRLPTSAPSLRPTSSGGRGRHHLLAISITVQHLPRADARLCAALRLPDSKPAPCARLGRAGAGLRRRQMLAAASQSRC